VASVRRLSAIMFTDMVGSTASAHANEAEALKLRDEQAALIRPLFSAHQGREIKSMGDGFLAEFDSALHAVQCAIDIQQHLHERNSQSGVSPIQVRIGVHLGDVEQRETDIFGDAVNIASRIEPTAEPGGICVSGAVHEQVRNKITDRFEKLPSQPLKGLGGLMDIYRVLLPWTLRVASDSSSGPRRLAVLPFSNISPDPKDEYFADGLTEELITILSQIPDLQVIARTSVMPYKSTSKPLQQIGSELGVASVLEGSVRKAGERLRITAQLIEVGSQSHVWANTYDRQLEDIFALQTEVAKQIAEVLKIKIGEPERRRLEQQQAVNPESYLAYLKGRSLLFSSFPEKNLREAKEQFELAVSIDATNARAHCGLADVLSLMGLWGDVASREEVWTTGRAHLARSLEIDPNLAEAHATLGRYLYTDCQTEEAERELKRALALNPSDSFAHGTYASMLEELARPEEALREYALAEETDPRAVIESVFHVRLLAFLRRGPEAWVVTERLGKTAPDSPEYHLARAWSHYAQANFTEALREDEKAHDLRSDRPGCPFIAAMLALKGDSARARQYLEELKPRIAKQDLYSLAEPYALLGDLDSAYRCLFEAFENRFNINFGMIRNDPLLQPLREDPRYPRFLREAWQVGWLSAPAKGPTG